MTTSKPVRQEAAPAGEVVLEVRGLLKSYGRHEVLKGVDLALHRGEVLAVIGPSGSGKSTMIRCLNMMEVPTGGTLSFLGRPIAPSFKGKGEAIGFGELRRRVGMVFQHFNLFPHKTVLQNVTEGPIAVLGLPRQEAEAIAMDLLGRVSLADKCNAYPNHLSGGQKQRVAIARALAMKPEVLLLDEVTSALDPELVGEVLKVIGSLAADGMTMVIVTHEMAFAADVASRVLFMDGGVVAAEGSAEEIIRAPANERLQSFLARFHA
ncbi:amino acid ABC transporter ATP-binding protein [Radicibacter daui]|uniref:amino acid ABC transporter ATP-binding protein n=1 Tax=Radicibacter daui TaxID=3064829 RepID=UPI0040469D5D